MDVVKVTTTFLAAFDSVYSAHLASLAALAESPQESPEYQLLNLGKAEVMTRDHVEKILNIPCLVNLRIAVKRLLLAMLEHREAQEPPSLNAITDVFIGGGYV